MYASRLARASVNVTMLTRTAAQAEALGRKGILFEAYGSGAKHAVPVQAKPIAELREVAESEDWIWLTVKQTHLTDDLLTALARLGSGGASVLCLQNGIGHMERLREALPETQLYAAISTEGALRTNEAAVRHTGAGELVFGMWQQAAAETLATQKMLLDILEAAGIEGLMSNEMVNRVYQKLLINAVINPLSAIFGVTNGELPADPGRRQLMAALHAESEAALIAGGMNGDGDAWERLLTVCRRTARNESSMLADVKSGRMTEIDSINGGIATIAREHGLKTPLNDALITIVKALTLN
ncbi:2-dehydropantoate 2-reductase [Paenibacillus plantiphilus]|uniref:2-dehydropantoate 2-reductase n=2 Tax=Paenibacillus plantiphilus TaxID=2905650 RepID=A0ABN8GNM2_9BACL|nr:2-dehydropantoate 2-reductase [Paenibacillus plantiphilus]